MFYNRKYFHKFYLTIILFSWIIYPALSQKVAFIASDVIRDKFSESKQAEQRIRSIVDEWKRELESLDRQIEELKSDIARNRLIWSDEEKRQKNKDLDDLLLQKQEYARKKFEQNGEYDATVKMMMQPVEDKIHAAVQSVAADEGFDFVLDKSIQPIPYANSKFDLTIKVLRKLGVDVKALEKELQEKIDKDPRNQKKTDSKTPPGKRTKSRTKTESDTREFERKEPQQPDVENQSPSSSPESEENEPFKKNN